MHIGITGHQKLDNPQTWSWIEGQFNDIISGYKLPLIGITSLAVGADQLFAKSVLKNGGELYVVLPFKNYDKTMKTKEDLDEYLRILRQAKTVETLEKKGSNEEAYLAAGKRVVDLSAIMLAVWNGKKAAGLGGTADIIEYSHKVKREVINVNPYLHLVQKFM